jgi:hypothetical protein
VAGVRMQLRHPRQAGGQQQRTGGCCHCAWQQCHTRWGDCCWCCGCMSEWVPVGPSDHRSRVYCLPHNHS